MIHWSSVLWWDTDWATWVGIQTSAPERQKKLGQSGHPQQHKDFSAPKCLQLFWHLSTAKLHSGTASPTCQARMNCLLGKLSKGSHQFLGACRTLRHLTNIFVPEALGTFQLTEIQGALICLSSMLLTLLYANTGIHLTSWWADTVWKMSRKVIQGQHSNTGNTPSKKGLLDGSASSSELDPKEGSAQ